MLNLLDDSIPQPTATEGAMQLDFGFGQNTGLASNAPYTTIASNPAFMSFASTFDSPSNSSPPTASNTFLSSPFNFDINSMPTWSSPPTTLQDSQLDDLFAGYLNAINSTDFSIPSQSSASVSPISHIAAPFRTGTSQTLSSSLPSAAPQTSKSSPDGQSPPPEKDSCRKAAVKELISSGEPSPFTLHAADIPCSKKGPVFPKTTKSDKNIEVVEAWNSITSNPKYKVCYYSEIPPGCVNLAL